MTAHAYAGRPKADDPGHGGAALFTYERVMEMNVAFAMAMLNARDAGLESFTLGPKKNRSGCNAAHFAPQPCMSLITSSAQACVEAPDPTSMPTRFMQTMSPAPPKGRR